MPIFNKKIYEHETYILRRKIIIFNFLPICDNKFLSYTRKITWHANLPYCSLYFTKEDIYKRLQLKPMT